MASSSNPIEMLFGGMEKLGPGSDDHTLELVRRLPKQQFGTIVDAGCGSGRQTLVLARTLGCVVHAVDLYEPFLTQLNQRAQATGLGDLVTTHCLDMADIPKEFEHVDLMWSEGSAYNIGFGNALSKWASAIEAGGLLVVSELTWLQDRAPEVARAFFSSAYPEMRPIEGNIALAEGSGYRVLETAVLPRDAWTDGYYDVLEPRAKSLVDSSDRSVRELAIQMLAEIEVFASSTGSYGYVFYVLERVG